MAIVSGLSNLTQQYQSGNTSSYTQSSDAVKSKYETWKKNSSGVSFKQFPPDSPENKIILVGRDYALGAVGVTFGISNQGTAQSGYILPLPETRLTDTYQVAYDSDFSFLNLIPFFNRGSRLEQAGRAVGVNLNKFKSVLMEAPMLKRHEFVWKLSPKSADESEMIRRIVNSLKKDIAPPVKLNEWILTFPYIFDVYFEPNFRWMYGFKPCVIESLDVNYSGGNPIPANYYNGAPESVIINMNLIEIEIWVRDDYERWENASDPVSTLFNSNGNRTSSQTTNPPDNPNLPSPWVPNPLPRSNW